MSILQKCVLLFVLPLTLLACDGQKKAALDAASGNQQKDVYNSNLAWLQSHPELGTPNTVDTRELQQALTHLQAMIDAGNSTLFYASQPNVSYDGDDKQRIQTGVTFAQAERDQIQLVLNARNQTI